MRDSQSWHPIYFQVGDKDYAFRVWPNVPRVGDHVMFHPVEGPAVYQVERVVWGVAKDDMNAPTVNVVMKGETA